jgi:hypothetical protein
MTWSAEELPNAWCSALVLLSWLQGGDGRSCVDMYFHAGKYEAAFRVARGCMPEQQMNALFNSQVSRAGLWD